MAANEKKNEKNKVKIVFRDQTFEGFLMKYEIYDTRTVYTFGGNIEMSFPKTPKGILEASLSNIGLNKIVSSYTTIDYGTQQVSMNSIPRKTSSGKVAKVLDAPAPKRVAKVTNKPILNK